MLKNGLESKDEVRGRVGFWTNSFCIFFLFLAKYTKDEEPFSFLSRTKPSCLLPFARLFGTYW
jgi:hypothetical protein